MKKLVILMFCLLIFTLNTMADDNDKQSIAAIDARLAPFGMIDIAGQTKTTQIIKNDSAIPDRSGKEVYDNVCYVCHSTGAAGSPKFGSAAAWNPRKTKGMKTLLQHALNGYNFMPPRGTCSDCSDGEIEEAIRYMITNSTQ